MKAIICTFSTSLSDLPRRGLTKAVVLAHLSRNPRFSTFDVGVDGPMPGIITDLFQQGLIVDDKKSGYPWHKVKLTPAGRKMLAKVG